MTESNNRWPAWRRVPPFLPVLLRGRADGWTPERQGKFVGLLAETGSVAEAARRVGMSRMAAYRLRRRPDAEDFAHAWEAVMAIRRGEEIAARKVTHAELMQQALEGPLVIRMRRGRFHFARREPCDSALMRLLARAGTSSARQGWGPA